MKKLSEQEQRWQQVLAREAGDFFYAVKSTGIYCRPGCSSRTPRRENVSFYNFQREAEAAGFRACKRCKPQQQPQPLAVDLLIERCCQALGQEEFASVRDLADELAVSESYLHRVFKQRLGVTPRQYRFRLQAEEAASQLSENQTVTETIYAAGYSSSSRFYEGVAKELGMSAKTAKKGAQGEEISYCFAESSLGQVLLAWTEKGACHLALGDDGQELLEVLKKRFSKAKLEETERPSWWPELLASVEQAKAVELPLDIRGTAFQERVWQQLRKIPAGETRTYSELAAELGETKAVRAVANACGANKLAVIIPCHRVIRADGGLGGYRWGIGRKKLLLQREKADT